MYILLFSCFTVIKIYKPNYMNLIILGAQFSGSK